MLSLAAAISVIVSPVRNGFSPPTAEVTSTADGVAVHGALCRRQILAARTPYGIRLRVIDARGDVLQTVTSPLIGNGLSGKNVGCAYYTARLASSLPPGVRILVSAER